MKKNKNKMKRDAEQIEFNGSGCKLQENTLDKEVLAYCLQESCLSIYQAPVWTKDAKQIIFRIYTTRTI